jgi:hypothetical protein
MIYHRELPGLLAKRLHEEQIRTLMTKPRLDYNGKALTHNVNGYLLDDSYPEKHERHIVLHTHNFLADDGTIGASGKPDPKEITVGDVQYRQLEHDNPRCALCEGGDMIPVEKRFKSSKYRPPAPE